DDDAPSLAAAKQVAALEVGQLDQELGPYHFAAQLADQVHDRRSGPAGGDQVVDHQHLLAGGDRVLVHVQDVGSVLQRVPNLAGLPRQLAGLADGNEAGAELESHSRPEDEAARLHRGDEVDTALRPG